MMLSRLAAPLGAPVVVRLHNGPLADRVGTVAYATEIIEATGDLSGRYVLAAAVHDVAGVPVGDWWWIAVES